MKNAILSLRAVAVAAALLSLLTTAEAGPPGPPQGTPQPKVLVIDRQAILMRSAAGQSIMQQARTMMQQLENEFKGQVSQLRSQRQQFEQQSSILASDLRAKKQRDIEGQAAALQQKAVQKQNMIKGGVLTAQQQIADAVGPILKGIMIERGANMLIDKQAVILSTVDLDVTPLAIQRLNQKLATVKVTPTPLPPGLAQNAQ